MFKYKVSNHAYKRKDQYFPKLNLFRELNRSVSCSPDEIGEMRKAPSYRRLKESDKKRTLFKKTPNGMYVICAYSLFNPKEVIDIITIIRPSEFRSSFITGEFKKQMIKSGYDLEMKTKKKGSGRINHEQVFEIGTLFHGQTLLLDQLKRLNDFPFVSQKIRFNDLDIENYTQSRKCIETIISFLGSIVNLKNLLKEEDEPRSEKEMNKYISQLANYFFGSLEYLKSNLLTKESFKNEKSQQAFNDILFKSLKVLNRTLSLINSHKIIQKKNKDQHINNMFIFYSEFFGINDKFDKHISILANKLTYIEKRILNELKRDPITFYINEVRNMKEALDKKISCIKDEDINELIHLNNVFNEAFNEMKQKDIIRMEVAI